MEIKKQQLNTVGSSIFYHHTLTTAQPADYTIGPEAHRQYELLYLLCGDLTYKIEGRAYQVHPGDLILIPPNDIHILQIGSGFDYERMVFHFNPELLERMLRDFPGQMPSFKWDIYNPVIPGEICRRFEIYELLLSMVESPESHPYRLPYTVAKMIELAIRLDKIFADGDLAMVQPVTVDPMIQHVIEYIDGHITQPISLDELASELYVSKSTLCHRFRAYINVTVNRYITVKKIYYAAELIQNGMPATAAAMAVGYSNYTTFFYNYKQIIGTSPTAGK